MKGIKQILIEGQGWISAEKRIEGSDDTVHPQGTYTTEINPITKILKNGEMANVDWYAQGNKEYNGKYVIMIEYF